MISGANYFPLDVVAANGGSGNLSDIIKLFSGNTHNCALQSTGTVVCWGTGSLGRLGNGADNNQGSPVSVIKGRSSSANLSGVIDLARGSNAGQICVQNAEGRILCWGRANEGQLGHNFTDGLVSGLSHPITVIDGDGSTGALMKVSTFRTTYSCLEGQSVCAIDPIELSIATGSVGSSDSVNIAVSGLASGQTLELYSESECVASSGSITASDATQEIALTSLAEGTHKFRYKVTTGTGGNLTEVVECSPNSITYVYDDTAPIELTLSVPSASGAATSVVVTVSAIEPGTIVKLYNGSDCSSSQLATTLRTDGVSEEISVDSLAVGVHNFRAQATDVAGNASTCQTTAASYQVTTNL